MPFPRTGRPRPLLLRAKPLLVLAPLLALIGGVLLYPLVRSVGIGFTDRVLAMTRHSFVGWENYVKMGGDPLFWRALLNSILLAAANVAGSIALGLGLALLLNTRGLSRAVYRTLLFLPWAFPSMVIALMFRWAYNDIYGWPNYILGRLGILAEPVNLLAGTGTAWPAVLLPLVWCFYPFVMLVFLSALQSINANLYEAAAIDGAGRWRSFRHVTLPALRPVLLVTVVLEAIWSFATFDLVFLLTGGGPANSTLTLSLYVYKQGFVSKVLGYASALGTVMFLVLAAFTGLYLWVVRRERLYEQG